MTNEKHTLVWKNCLKVIGDIIPLTSYKTWFEPIVPLKLSNNVLTIEVPSNFFREYLEEHFIDLMSRSLRRELGAQAKLEYSVRIDSSGTSVTMPPQGGHAYKNKPVSFAHSPKGIANPFVIPGLQQLEINPQLNPAYSFDHFIEGSCNRLARSAGFSIASNPGRTAFNPLFLYGSSGLGKTHLAQAIGIAIKEQSPDQIVLYVNANRFQTQYQDATVNNTATDFMNFYQMIDVLIIDDVQEFAGKEKTQETFFHIFNHLHQTNRQLILTSDKPATELKGLEHRLLSRFKWGLTAELTAPDLETRIEILKQKTYKDGIELPYEILEYIATSINTNVRELEGALVSLLAQSMLNKKEITLELTANVIDKLVKGAKAEFTIEYIAKVVCDYFKMPVDSLQEKTRKREIVQARQLTMYFSKNLTKFSLSNIGANIGNKDHATVLHACKTINNLIETDKIFKQYVDEIEKRLKM
ncbi:MAG: chromosomal replication initiator protein DnaA [Prolixibacteraceae bacterium]|nr:chromosomal replication initiator protein DnaA [Prolixibacteraceae bacterium]